MSDCERKVRIERLSWSNLPSVLLAFSLSWLTNDVQFLARTTSTCKRWLTDHRVGRLFEQALKQKLSDRGDPMSIVEQPVIAGADGKANWRTRCGRYFNTLSNFWRVDVKQAMVGSLSGLDVNTIHLERSSDVLWLGYQDGLIEARDLNNGKLLFQRREHFAVYLIAVDEERTAVVAATYPHHAQAGGRVSVLTHMKNREMWSVPDLFINSVDFWQSRYVLLAGYQQVAMFSFDRGECLGKVDHLGRKWSSPIALFQSERQIVIKWEVLNRTVELITVDVSEDGRLGKQQPVDLASATLSRGSVLDSSAWRYSLIAKQHYVVYGEEFESVAAAEANGMFIYRTGNKLRAVQVNDKGESVRQRDLLTSNGTHTIVDHNWRWLVHFHSSWLFGAQVHVLDFCHPCSGPEQQWRELELWSVGNEAAGWAAKRTRKSGS